jgi:hypothetical protein
MVEQVKEQILLLDGRTLSYRGVQKDSWCGTQILVVWDDIPVCRLEDAHGVGGKE